MDGNRERHDGRGQTHLIVARLEADRARECPLAGRGGRRCGHRDLEHRFAVVDRELAVLETELHLLRRRIVHGARGEPGSRFHFRLGRNEVVERRRIGVDVPALGDGERDPRLRLAAGRHLDTGGRHLDELARFRHRSLLSTRRSAARREHDAGEQESQERAESGTIHGQRPWAPVRAVRASSCATKVSRSVVGSRQA